MTLYQRTIPSAVIGEIMADLQAIRQKGWEGTHAVRNYSPFARHLQEWVGRDVRNRYPFELWKLIEAQKAEGAKKAEPKRAKPGRRQRNDARVNDKKIRAVMLASRNKESGRVNRGLRRIAIDAGVSAMSVRRALASWEASGQITLHRYPRGRTTSIELHLEHPAWSECKALHSSAA
jgi:hypothetical protein